MSVTMQPEENKELVLRARRIEEKPWVASEIVAYLVMLWTTISALAKLQHPTVYHLETFFRILNLEQFTFVLIILLGLGALFSFTLTVLAFFERLLFNSKLFHVRRLCLMVGAIFYFYTAVVLFLGTQLGSFHAGVYAAVGVYALLNAARLRIYV